MFFADWSNIYRVAVVGALAYSALVVLLRLSGNRTLSKMNAFDLVVTVAFGSTLATILVNRNVSLAVGLAALALLVAMQFVVTWSCVRSSLLNRIVKTAPTVLVLRGELCPDALKRVRVTSDEVLGAVRQHGYGGLDLIEAVVLETDGSLSVISRGQAGDGSALSGLDA
ncbi:uncharacterized protein DUF421 [Pseudoduganella flava]|uniref:DUF421 domain-containing protein n=1 Tax=Pseudoduganella flava TaxID=871742 RepID=A0A562PR10_9BURK|nr:YetF domain-containing protein [Pseudoduganella flava]QGZ37788.1 DUF421 domain-containing protein [Pseudoduganella flava]TWI46600.1 uncharacterized protein DUF421 [Pseudoduganella flava]